MNGSRRSRSQRIRGLIGLLACTALWFLGSVLAAPGAQAHAELVSSSPADGTRLTAIPKEIALTFSEGIAVGECAVEVSGKKLPIHAPAGQADPVVLTADLTGVQPHGDQLVLTWRSVSSDDGHVATGTLHFSLALAATPASPTSQAVAPPSALSTTQAAALQPATPAAPATAIPAIAGPNSTVKDVIVASQAIGFAGTAVFVGGMAFLAMIWPEGGADRRTRRLLTAAWAVGLITALADIPLRAGYSALRPLSGVFDGAAVQSLLDTRLGTVLVARALLWVPGAIILSMVLQQADRAARSPAWRIGHLAVGLGLLRTTGMPAHDDTAHPVAGAIADTVHLAGVSLWIGGLVILLFGVLPRRRPDELAFVVARYSNIALASVLAIVAAGAVLSWQLIGSVHALTHTSYGHLLLIKLGIVGTVMLLAQHSKSWVRHRLDIAVLLNGDRLTVRPFIYSVAAETGLALAILTVASVLVTSSPGR